MPSLPKRLLEGREHGEHLVCQHCSIETFRVWPFLLGKMFHFNFPDKTAVIENVKSLQNFLNPDKTKTLLLILSNCLVFLICFSSETWFFQCSCIA